MSAPKEPFRIELVDDYSAALPELRAVREVVFIQEQQVPPDLELDAADPGCTHVIARDAQGRAIGTARLSAERKIGRMAVLPDWRNAGVGAAMLQALLRQGRGQGWKDVFLHAQAGAIDFYLRHGFVAQGSRFMEAGIEHQTMRLALNQPQPVNGSAAAVAIAIDLISGAQRRLWIHSRALDPGLFDDRRVLEALRQLGTRRNPGTEVQILLHDAAAPQRAHAPLLALAQRLPTVFNFREVADQVDRAYVPAFLVNDAGGFYFRSLGHRFEGEADRHAPGRARQLTEVFRPVWERSRPCSELRALGI